jgi:aspartyl-tRNA(Asn)/glutamyl-tRNA(Gln) amidotransferase subunit A
MQPWQLSATELADAFARGETTPERHLELLQPRIERLNPRLNAIVASDVHAMDAARDSTSRLETGRARSRLEGIPVVVKDNILVAGLPCVWGSRVFRDYVPAADELPVARLRAAGAIILGKTNVPELTFEGITWNPVFGATRNPYDLRLTPGGSSGGSVAAVASGLVPLALGTDGGGSIRRPASHAGVVGLKPSIGRVPRFPSLPTMLLDFEVIGPIARTAADARLLLDAMSGAEPRDQSSLCHPLAIEQGARDPLRVLYVERFGAAPLDPEVAASVGAAVGVFESLGYCVERGALPLDLTTLNDFWSTFGAVGVARVMLQHPGKEHLLGPRFQQMLAAGRDLPASRYLAWIEAIGDFRRAAARAFERYDLIITPSAAALPWEAETPYPDTIDGQPVGPRGHAIYTAWVNACGHPGINLPCAPSKGGLPIGLQLVGRFGADALLLDVAQRFEQALPWRDRWPALAFEA